MKSLLFNHSARTLADGLFANGRIPHALLLEGEAGCGKTTFATELAAKILCTGSTRPCGECPACHKVEHGTHPDILVIEKEAGAQVIKVDAIRRLISNAYIAPNEGSHTVVIIREAQLLGASSQNALLKLIEEPPPHLAFILTAQNRLGLLGTILSRVTVISLETPTVEQCMETLPSLCPGKSDDEYKQAATLTGGNIGAAISILEQSGGAYLHRCGNSIAKAMATDSEYTLLKELFPFEKNRDTLLELLQILSAVFAKVLLCKKGATFPDPQLTEIARHITPLQAASFIDIIEDVYSMAVQNTDRSVLLCSFTARIKAALED